MASWHVLEDDCYFLQVIDHSEYVQHGTLIWDTTATAVGDMKVFKQRLQFKQVIIEWIRCWIVVRYLHHCPGWIHQE